MAGGNAKTSHQRKRKPAHRSRSGPTVKKARRYEVEEAELSQLQRRVEELLPAPGSLTKPGCTLPGTFADLPLSAYTLHGLERGNFSSLTKIQQLSILHALAGRDILASAKTGSGKTLAFLVPVLERMYHLRWSADQGVGAVIVSPTRELALQIYEVLTVVGAKHRVTAGLLIGGSMYRKEKSMAVLINILVCTPGRFLQHLEQTPYFNVGDVHTLVLDEADRLLDMGFKKQLVEILQHLPKTRQTMLFSATQTKSVKDLAKLSLRSPERISVHAQEKHVTPAGLLQAYAVVPLASKMDVLYSFIRSHLKSKIIVFLSTCPQVQFVDAAIRRLQPGIPVMCLNGKVKQKRRMHVYYEFIAKKAAVLLATDIVGRGLDFPSVDWVVQLDCPEDVETYIHRVGRTARYKDTGKALLFLLENEAKGFVPLLDEAKIPISKKDVNPARMNSIVGKLKSECAKDATLKARGAKAFKSYMRSIHLQPNKNVFDVHQLPMGEFARSLGLSNTPRVKFIGQGGEKTRKQLRKQKNTPNGLKKLTEEPEDFEHLATSQPKKTKYERLMARKPQVSNGSGDDSESDSDDGLVFRGQMKPLSNDTADAAQDDEEAQHIQEELERRKKRARVKINKAGTARGKLRGKKVVFGEDGEERSPFERVTQSLDTAVAGVSREKYLSDVKERLQQEDKIDQEVEREKVKTRRREKKIKARKRRQDEGGEEAVAVLGSGPEGASDDEAASEGEGRDMDEEMEENKRWLSKNDLEAQALALIGMS